MFFNDQRFQANIINDELYWFNAFATVFLLIRAAVKAQLKATEWFREHRNSETRRLN